MYLIAQVMGDVLDIEETPCFKVTEFLVTEIKRLHISCRIESCRNVAIILSIRAIPERLLISDMKRLNLLLVQ